jgi:hypothetical protein
MVTQLPHRDTHPRTPARKVGLRFGRRAVVLGAVAALLSFAGAVPAAFASTQESSPFPYDPGGVTFSGGLAGGLLTFSIPAGRYSLNVVASYDPANDPDGSGQCLFSGALDYLSGSGGSAPLGGIAPVTSWVPFVLGPLAGSYGAGDYKIYIYPETTCSWTVELWRDAV